MLRSASVVALSAFATLAALSIGACGDDGAAETGTNDDAGSPEHAGCENLAPLVASATPGRVRAGGSVDLGASGGSGSYAFAITSNGSGGSLEGQRYIAGPKPAEDILAVTDTMCGSEARATISVIAPFHVAPKNAVVRPGTTFTIVTDGLLGKAVFQLQSSTADSSVDATGRYAAGSHDGIDAILVRDDVGGDEATLRYEVRADAALATPCPRIAMPPSSSIPLIATGGSDTIAWEKISGPGIVQQDRFASAANDPAPSRLRGRDAFTGDVVELDVRLLDPAEPAGQMSDALGSSVALVARSASAVAAFGAPAFQGVGRAYASDTASDAIDVIVEGAASPLHRGRRVGAAVAFTDFNGDGRPDLVSGAPELTIPTQALRATEITPFYATERAACVPANAQSKGGLLVSLGQADGSFKSAYRLWHDVAGVGDLGFDVAGGFDFNGDGQKDLAASRESGLDVFLGRAPDDSSLAKLTMGCSPLLSIPKLPAPATAVASLGDVDGDGCEEVAVSYHDATHGGVMVLFGFDPGGARCAARTVPGTVRISADGDGGESYLGMGVSLAQAGRFLGGTKSWLAVSADHLSLPDGENAGVLLLDMSAIAALRPPSGNVTRGLAQAALPSHVLSSVVKLGGFGQAIAGGADLTGDGIVDLVVGAPGASFSAAGSGVALVFAGGTSSTGALRPHTLIAGDDGTPSGLGPALSLLPKAGARPALLAVGSPTSARKGAGNGAAYLLPFP